MDIYDCSKEVFYGAMTFSPDAELDSKERTLKYPVGTEIDNVIATCFTKREDEQEEVKTPIKIGEGDKILNEIPDELSKLQRDSDRAEAEAEVDPTEVKPKAKAKRKYKKRKKK